MTTLGIGNNMNFTFDGMNNIVEQIGGNLTLENLSTTGSVIVKLGSTDANTEFNVFDSTGTNSLFRVQGDGTITPAFGGGTGNWVFNSNDAGLAGDTDLIQLAVGGITFNGSKTITLAADTRASCWQVDNNSGDAVFCVRGDRIYTARQPNQVNDMVVFSNALGTKVFSQDTYNPRPWVIRNSDPFRFEQSSTNFPISNTSGAIYTVGGNFYWTGGQSAQVNIYVAYAEDPLTWTDTGDDVPGSTETSMVYHGQDGVYIYGSSGGDTDQILYASYDTPTTFTLAGSMPVANNAGHIIKGDNGPVMFGGSTSNVYQIDPVDPTSFTLIAAMSGAITAISNFGAVLINNETFLIGGSRTGGDGVSIYKVTSASPAVTVDTGFDFPVTATLATCYIVGDYVYALVNAGSKIYRALTTNLGSWTATAVVPSDNFVKPSVYMADNKVYIVGVLNSIYVTEETVSINAGGTNENVILGRSAYDPLSNNKMVSIGFDNSNGSTTNGNQVAIGEQVLVSQTNGSGNVGIGITTAASMGTLYSLTSGSFHTFVGSRAGEAITTTSQSTGLGYQSMLSNDFTNCTCLGANTAVTGANQVQLGDAATTTYVYGTVQNRSDQRDKSEIADTDLGSDFVYKLKPRKFRWDYRSDYTYGTDENGNTTISDFETVVRDGSKKRSRYHYGLIAQELKSTMDELGMDFGGYQDHKVKGGKDVLTIGYEELICPLIKTIQDQQAIIEDLESRITALEP